MILLLLGLLGLLGAVLYWSPVAAAVSGAIAAAGAGLAMWGNAAGS